MGREGGEHNGMHRRLTVVPVGTTDRPAAVAALRARGRFVDRAGFADAVRATCDRRRQQEQAEITELDERARALLSRRSTAERVFADLAEEQGRTLEAAEWCELQGAADAEDVRRVASSSEALEERSRAVREANRKLERVLEQRAAAEDAVEEARRQLDGLEAAGIDETGVRRRIEEASRELREASADYQEQMKELARCEAVVGHLEDQLGVAPSGDGDARRDQLQAMRAALDAKFAPTPDPGTPPATAEGLEAARSSWGDAQAAVEAAAERLARARTQVSALEAELSARSDGDASPQARYDAALELEAQVSAVESRLADAEIAARTEVDEATREMTRAERSLEQLREQIRERRRRLQTYARVVPDDRRVEVAEDPVLHAGIIARALRDHAADMQTDVDHARRAVEDARLAHEHAAAEFEQRREEHHAVTAEDRREAVRSLGTDGAAPVVLDGVVSVDAGPEVLSTEDLDLAELDFPLVVLTEEPAVVGWAIELPAERGSVASAAAVRDGTTRAATTALAPDPPAEQHSAR